MIDEGKGGIPFLLPAIFLLTACVLTRNDDAAGVSKGDQYLRYGVEAFAAGQPAVAESRFNWALGIFEKNGDLDGQIRAHINLAEQAFYERDMSRAAAHIKRAEELVTRSSETGYQRRILLIQSSIALNQGDYNQVRTILTGLLGDRGEQAASQTRDAVHLAALINRAALSRKQNDGEFAYWFQELKQSFTADQNTSPSFTARLQRFEAELYRRSGEFNKADASLERALLSYESGSFNIEVGATLREWAQLDIERDRWFQASDKLRRLILLKGEDGDRERVIEGLQLLVKVELECGRPDEADALRKLVQVLGNKRTPYGTCGWRIPIHAAMGACGN